MATAKLEPLHILSNAQNIVFRREADAFAGVLATSKELTAAFEEAIAIDFENALTTANIHFTLFESVPGLDEEKLKALPYPSTVEGYTGNKPYDIFWYKDLDGNKQRASYWGYVRDLHPVGAAIRKELQAITDGAKKDVKNAYSDDVMSQHDRDSEKKDWNKKLTTFSNKLKMAVQCYFKMEEARTEMGAIIEVDYDTKAKLDDKGNPVIENKQVVMEINRKSPNLIVVSDKARKGTAARFSISNFIRLNVETAKANGGTYGAFIKSNARETPEEEQPKPQAQVGTPADFESVTATTLHFLNGAKSSHNGHMFRSLVGYYSAAGSDDRLQTLVNLRDQIDVILGVKEIKQRVDAFTMTPAEKRAAA